jgi:hypothetical protein
VQLFANVCELAPSSLADGVAGFRLPPNKATEP